MKLFKRHCARCGVSFAAVGGFSETPVGWMLLRLCVQCVMFLDSGAALCYPGGERDGRVFFDAPLAGSTKEKP